MDLGLFAQYVMNGLMLGMMYALVAVGFTLFFGVLDVISSRMGTSSRLAHSPRSPLSPA